MSMVYYIINREVLTEKCNCLSLNLLREMNFEYDEEDDLWYAKDYGFRVQVKSLYLLPMFILYYGGFGTMLGDFLTIKSFKKAMKNYKIINL